MSQTQSPTSELVAGAAAGESREWNWHPSLPIETSPVFKALPRPFASLKWYADAWLPLSELALFEALVRWVWYRFQLEQAAMDPACVSASVAALLARCDRNGDGAVSFEEIRIVFHLVWPRLVSTIMI